MTMLREILLFIMIETGESFHRQRYGHYPIICPTGERIQGTSLFQDVFQTYSRVLKVVNI